MQIEAAAAFQPAPSGVPNFAGTKQFNPYPRLEKDKFDTTKKSYRKFKTDGSVRIYR